MRQGYDNLLLDADETLLAADIVATLSDTCTIRAYTSDQTSTGGRVRTYADSATDVPFALSTGASYGKGPGARLAILADYDYVGHVPVGTSVTEKDRLVHNSITYEVLKVFKNRTGEPVLTLGLGVSK